MFFILTQNKENEKLDFYLSTWKLVVGVVFSMIFKDFFVAEPIVFELVVFVSLTFTIWFVLLLLPENPRLKINNFKFETDLKYK